MKNNLSRWLKRRFSSSPPGGSYLRPKQSRWRQKSVLLILFLFLLNIGTAQNLIVNGTVKNTGKIRVKNQTSFAQDSVNGEIELKGANQVLPAKHYQTVRLTGTGTKTTSGGNLAVAKNLTVVTPVILNIQKGNVLTLGDTLFESGMVTGAIQKSVNLTGSTTSSNFGNIGATVSWSSTAPGITNILRASDSVQFGNGNESIKRYYEISPADASATGNILFKFADNELNGHNINNLQLWRSTDNGINWVRHIPVVDTTLRTISKTNVALKGLWTASDTVRALGPLQGAAGIPTIIANASTQNIEPIILTTLDTIKILITDVFGTPVGNVPVTFGINSRPDSLAGGTLSDTNVVTNSSGFATTIFTLGSKVGQYEVIAASSTLNDTIRIPITAKHGAPQSLAELAITPQTKVILSQLDSLFTVIVTDIGGNAVDSVQVQFSIVDIPTGSFGHQLTATNVPTDSLGRASTQLTLGSKAAPYKVRAIVSGVSDTANFTATATAGVTATTNQGGGNNQTGIVGTAVNPFEVVLLDIGQNPVAGDTVEFRISSTPGGSDSGSLSATKVITNALGNASVILTLGTKSGPYTVSAENKTSGGSLTFTATAQAAAASVLAEISGNNQTLPILSELTSDFVVEVRDTFGNAVNNAMVKFTIDSLTANGSGAHLSVDSIPSDPLGRAATRLTLGYKDGLYKVNATVNGVPVVSFNANASVGAAKTLVTVSGNAQSSTIISPLPNEFVIRVLDIGGNNVPNTPVQFSIDSTPTNAVGQQLSVTTINSGSDGTARTQFTVGNKVGTYRIRARVTGIPDTFFIATATHGAAAAMAPIAGLNQTKPILSGLDIPFTVRISDIGDNNVPIQNVQFSIINRPNGDTSAALSNTTAQTDSFGFATTQLTLGSKVGVYEVKAFVPTTNIITLQNESRTVGAKKSVSELGTFASIETTFTARATQGAAAAFVNIVGDRQTKPTSTTLDTTFTLRVKDIGGNDVINSDVYFRIDSIPLFATGQMVRDSVVKTDSLGVASTVFTLGNREGTYIVTANAEGLIERSFTSNAFYVYGDPNNDLDVNVADITTLIDHATGHAILSEVDSIKSDINKDGMVDTTDVGILRDAILERPIFASTVPDFLGSTNEWNSLSPVVSSLKKQSNFSGATTQFEATAQGLRLNLNNTVTVRGVELRIRLKDTTLTIENISYLFARAQDMSVIVKSANHEFRMLAYSLQNIEIQPGEGSIVRIPKITSLDQIDTAHVILSVANNAAVIPEVTITAAPAGKYPTTFRLEQNFPNPFNGATTIRYEIPDQRSTETKTAIHIFNVLGQKVRTLISAPHDPGQYTITWNGTDDNGVQVSSGVYFYRLITKNHLTTKKMIYVK